MSQLFCDSSICEEVLKYPVTNLCGHTFCRECCFGHTKCNVCDQKFPIISTLLQNLRDQPSCSSNTVASNEVQILKSSTITSETSSTASDGETENDCVTTQVYPSVNNSDTCRRCGGFEQDILIRKLVEKWWAPLLKASEFNKEAEQNLNRNLLDEALKNCNQSLEQGKVEFLITKFCIFYIS